MKFIIFTTVIAFILEDYGTFQVKPIDRCSQIEEFKKYALEWVSAAVTAISKNKAIMNGGSECISYIDMDEEPSVFDVYLATMSIAKDYQNDLKLIKETSKISGIEKKIDAGMMKNIRLILDVLHSSPDIFMAANNAEFQILAKYVFVKKPNSSKSASQRSLESVMKCYLSLRSTEYEDNPDFFNLLAFGAKVGNALIHAEDEDSEDATLEEDQAKLSEFIEDIREFQLKTPDDSFQKDRVEAIRDMWGVFNSE